MSASALIVVLNSDLSDEHVKQLITAIDMLYGVHTVKSHIPENITQLVAECRVKGELRLKLANILQDTLP